MKKSATHSRNQTFDLEPAKDNTAGTVDNSGTMEPDNGQDLAQLGWKHFPEGFTQALQETQEALAPAQSGLLNNRYLIKKGQKMSKAPNNGRTLSFVSIWEAPARKVLSDTHEYKKAPTSVIGIEALRTINRIVLAIQDRIDAAERIKPGNDAEPCSAGDPRGSRTTISNSGTDSN